MNHDDLSFGAPEAPERDDDDKIVDWVENRKQHGYYVLDREELDERLNEATTIAYAEGRKDEREELAKDFPGDRKLMEALDKYINPVLQELQFERGSNSLAAHNLRLCLIEVMKALKGERNAEMHVGVGFPLSGVTVALRAEADVLPDAGGAR